MHRGDADGEGTEEAVAVNSATWWLRVIKDTRQCNSITYIFQEGIFCTSSCVVSLVSQMGCFLNTLLFLQTAVQ